MAQAQPEIEALWASVFGGPPPVTGTAALMLEILIRHLPPAPPYGEPAVARGPAATADEPSAPSGPAL